MARRPWTPADMVGVTGLIYAHSERNVAQSTVDGETAVESVTFVDANGAPVSTIAKAARPDYRPSLGTLNGKQTIFFDGNTRQLPIADPSALAKGPGNKFWFGHFHALETRSGDYYPLGYGGGNGTGIAYKLRVGSRFTIDLGNFGFDAGSATVSGPVSFVHVYEQTGTRSRAWVNADGSPTVYSANALNTSASNARLGSWPQYGNHSRHHFKIWGSAYGTPTVDDVIRLRAWCSWESGENGANLAADDPYKNERPWVEEGPAESVGTSSGSSTVSGEGRSTAGGAGTASASSVASGAGAAIVASNGAATGSSAVAGAGRAIAIASGSSTGSSSAQAAGTGIVSASGTGAGASVAAGDGRATAVTTGTAIGSTTVQGAPADAAIVTASGTASGRSDVLGAGSSRAVGAGAGTGASAAQAQGRAVVSSAGAAVGGSSAAGAGRAIVSSNGAAAGGAIAAGEGRATAKTTGTAAGSSTVSGRSPVAPQYPVPAARRVRLSDTAQRRVTIADTAARRVTLADQARRRVTIA